MTRSPAITALTWGRIDTAVGAFRDVKLWPGGGRGWDWTETDTHHEPGVRSADIAELVDRGAQVVVIGCGQQSRLGVTSGARTEASDRGMRLEVLDSVAAVARYNELAVAGEPVGALIHSTC
jgi:hypothetical protein